MKNLPKLYQNIPPTYTFDNLGGEWGHEIKFYFADQFTSRGQIFLNPNIKIRQS